MPVTVSHALSATTPDNPAYEIQPQHWNSGHNITLAAAGSEISGAFTNGGGVSFGLSANGALSATVATTYAGSNHSHGNPSLNLTNLSGTTASNSAGFTLSLSAGNYLTTAALSNHSHGNPTLNLTNLSGTTASNSAGFTLSLSAAAPGAAAEANAINLLGANTAGNTTATGSTIGWSGVNLTLSGTNASQVVISGPGTSSLSGTGALSISANGSTISLGVGTVTVSATSNTTQASSGTVNLNGLILNGAGGVSIGVSNGSLVFSGATGGAGGVNAANLLGANTAGNTTATGNTLGFSGLNLTLSGTNASQIVFSAPATSSLVGVAPISISTNGSTISLSYSPTPSTKGFFPNADLEHVAGTIGQGSLLFDPQSFPDIAFDRVLLPIVNTNSSNSSGSHTVSVWVGIYTRNASTLSLVHSASTSTAVTHSGTAGSYSLYSGVRLLSIPMTTTLTDGKYFVGIVSRTTSGGTNGTYQNLLLSQMASNFFGHFGSAHNTTMQFTLGQGFYSATTSGMPASVGFNQIDGSNSLGHRMPALMYASSTV